MRKIPAFMTTTVFILILSALASQAIFSAVASPSSTFFSGGNLQLNLHATDAPEDGISGLSGGDRAWIPGDHREALVTIKNTGSLPARWRLGFMAQGSPDPVLVDNIIISWYQSSGDEWQLIDSQRLSNKLIDGSSDNWLYDKALLLDGGFQPLAPGREARVVLQVDLELSATHELQNQTFTGQLLLQGAQLTGEEWFPTDSIPLNVLGPNSL